MSPVLPAQHLDPSIEATRPYVTGVVQELSRNGFEVRRSWLDPFDPRDATIQFLAEPANGSVAGRLEALVWDEECGWRYGSFISGMPGERTALVEPTSLGGGLLPSGAEVARRLASRAKAQRHVWRRWNDYRDGFEDALRQADAYTR